MCGLAARKRAGDGRTVESVQQANASRGENADVHELPKKKTAKKQPAKKTTAKKTTKKTAARRPRSA
ncbi:hypothetical protein [Streptomyces sp. NRRL S-646]|uniref:hypothetical protein n=1 Tax=Streptomyces sp. NRRL S-646 TaxID=1463917 RepID=UPI0004CBD7D1|nr:hypothetical protein [Streptomyces sp. NRRL S-646]